MKIIMCFIFFTSYNYCFSQAEKKVSTRKNSFYFSPQFHTNFDETKILSSPFSKLNKSLPIGLSINYSRQLTETNTICIGLSAAQYRNPYWQEYSKYGTVDSRTFSSIEFNTIRAIFVNKYQKLSRIIGGQLRIGSEAIHDNFYSANGFPWQCYYPSNTLLDVGINTGLKYEIFLGSRFSFSSELIYTFYPLTIDSKDSWEYEDKGSARHLLAFRVGAGYHFGKHTFKPEDDSEKNNQPFKHSFSFYKSLYQFFDGSPMIESKGKYAQIGPSTSGSYGIEYQNRISMKSFWSIAIEDFEFRSEYKYSDAKNRRYVERNFGLLNVAYLRSIFQSEKVLLLARTGICLRYGQEITQGERPAADNYKSIHKEYRDFGFVNGIKYTLLLNKHFYLLSKVNYTFLAYISASSDHNYFWDKKPSRHMLSFSVGLGFNN